MATTICHEEIPCCTSKTVKSDRGVPVSMEPDRDEGGKFAPRVTDSDVLRALRAQSDPVATAGELADVLAVSSETVRRHLTELHDDGRVGRKEVGARAVVWWPVDDRREDGDSERDDPLFGMPTFSGAGPADVSANVDEHLAVAIAGESEETADENADENADV